MWNCNWYNTGTGTGDVIYNYIEAKDVDLSVANAGVFNLEVEELESFDISIEENLVSVQIELEPNNEIKIEQEIEPTIKIED